MHNVKDDLEKRYNSAIKMLHYLFEDISKDTDGLFVSEEVEKKLREYLPEKYDDFVAKNVKQDVPLVEQDAVNDADTLQTGYATFDITINCHADVKFKSIDEVLDPGSPVYTALLNRLDQLEFIDDFGIVQYSITCYNDNGEEYYVDSDDDFDDNLDDSD